MPVKDLNIFDTTVYLHEMRNPCKSLVRKPGGKRPVRRPRHRWEDTARMNLREVGWEDVDWMHLVQDTDQRWALVNIVTNLWVP
jgi:hypothetical protein